MPDGSRVRRERYSEITRDMMKKLVGLIRQFEDEEAMAVFEHSIDAL
ncbi:MAG TPA: hypothetical protein VK957_04705 [Lunatimonas sp.]|nr:hypothetical protein [Lunatimonas sp.]